MQKKYYKALFYSDMSFIKYDLIRIDILCDLISNKYTVYFLPIHIDSWLQIYINLW